MTAIASAAAGASSPDAATASANNNTPYTFEEKRKRIFAIFAASSGNLVEWFDFYVYAFCAIYFAPAFFPKSDPTVQLLNTAGVFAAGSSCGRSAAGCSAASRTARAARPRW